jgi:DSF synthase
MNVGVPFVPKDPHDFTSWEFVYLDVDYDPEAQALWMNYKASAPHHFPLQMFREIIEVRESLRYLYASGGAARQPIRYFAIGSKRPNVFSLGGDLAAFAAAVRKGDHATLRAHANICVDIMHGLEGGFGLPIVTLSAVNGRCLGGGFEGALVTDFLIVERNAKLGLPEIAFNAFPGMGAVSLLTRRAGPALAEQIISSGSIYSGQEMFDLGVVDILAADGKVRETATAWMRDGGEARWLKRRALAEARRKCFPTSREEFDHIVDLWVECVKALTDQDLRHMDRLVAAQRRLSRGDDKPAHRDRAAESAHRSSIQKSEN